MRKYIPLVLFIFSWPVLSADIHGRGGRGLDGDTIEEMDSRKAVRIRLVNGEEIIDEDIARLSPLMLGHINMLGHYTFTLPEDILKGEL